MKADGKTATDAALEGTNSGYVADEDRFHWTGTGGFTFIPNEDPDAEDLMTDEEWTELKEYLGLDVEF